jgi:hypothetical protein
MGKQPLWTVTTPPAAGKLVKTVLSEHVALMHAWWQELIDQGTNTADEVAALQDPGASSSWAAPMQEQFGPVPTIARDGKRVIAGLDMWQQQRDRYWFIADLVRDRSIQYRDVGRDVVESSLMWWTSQFARSGYGLCTFAMNQETSAVEWWTRFLNRGPHKEKDG